MNEFICQPGGYLSGSLRVPGDKSISHRSIMLGSLAEGTTRVSGFLEGEDSLATLRAFRTMGVRIEGPDAGGVIIHGVGMHGLNAPVGPLDLGRAELWSEMLEADRPERFLRAGAGQDRPSV